MYLLLAAPLPLRTADDRLSVALVAIGVLALICVWLIAKVSRLSRIYARLTAGADEGNIANVLDGHLGRVEGALARSEEIAAALAEMNRRLAGCVQHVGLVRFDAFDDTGGQVSFALALLDEHGTGVVFSTLHDRKETRLFTKAVKDGQADVLLSAEEAEAMRRAGFEPPADRIIRR